MFQHRGSDNIRGMSGFGIVALIRLGRSRRAVVLFEQCSEHFVNSLLHLHCIVDASVIDHLSVLLNLV